MVICPDKNVCGNSECMHAKEHEPVKFTCEWDCQTNYSACPLVKDIHKCVEVNK